MPSPLPIALVEMNSQSDILANLCVIEQAVQLACHPSDGRPSKLVVLPENAFGFGNQAHVAQFFEPLKDWCGKLARHYNVHLLAGTLPCPFRPSGSKVTDGKFRQSSLLFDPSGEPIARYDKIHLFKATVNDSTGSYDEGKTFEAGDTPVVAKAAIGNIGMMVCFDLRFAPLALTLRNEGADILTAPSAFTYQTGKVHWQSLLTARALDSQCLVIGAGQAGEHFFTNKQSKTSRQTWGHSQFINANGDSLGKAIDLTIDFDTSSALLSAAKTWLPKMDDRVVKPCHNRVMTALFDPLEQQHYRQAIDLQASQRFDITMRNHHG